MEFDLMLSLDLMTSRGVFVWKLSSAVDWIRRSLICIKLSQDDKGYYLLICANQWSYFLFLKRCYLPHVVSKALKRLGPIFL